MRILEGEGIAVTTDRIDGFEEKTENTSVKKKTPLSAESIRAFFNM